MSTVGAKLQMIVDMIEAGIIDMDQAVALMHDTNEVHTPAHKEMEDVEMSLP